MLVHAANYSRISPIYIEYNMKNKTPGICGLPTEHLWHEITVQQRNAWVICVHTAFTPQTTEYKD